MKSEAMEAKLATTTLSTYAQEDFVEDIFRGEDGTWMDFYYAKDGYLACGMAIRNEGKLFIGDDSANNALKLIFCHELNWKTQYSQKLNEGLWGSWGEDFICPEGTYINSARVKYEDSKVYYADSNRITVVSDKTGMNGIEFVCKDPKINGIQDKYTQVVPGSWGTWKSWVGFDSLYVCGGSVRFEGKNGKDETALNGVRFKFCPKKFVVDGLNSINDGKNGDWGEVVVGPSNYYPCGLQLRMDSLEVYTQYGQRKDNTGLNGIKMKLCNINNWSDQTESTVTEGLYGDWGSYMICDQGYFINSIQVKYDDHYWHSSDYLALTGLSFTCNSPTNKKDYYQDVYAGKWYEKTSFSDKYMCGLQVRLDRHLRGDNASALNGIRVKLCSNAI
jgi:hypothetical protein